MDIFFIEQLFASNKWLLPIVSALIALISVWVIHPRLVKLALLKGIVDNPNHRKLQRIPVPVLGGVAVFFGISLSLGTVSSFYDSGSLCIFLGLMTVMLYVGTIDDIMGLSASVRFAVEIFCIVLLMFVCQISINDFHGLWGITRISLWIAVPLTLFITVGIINSINLIDGVNGLSSGFCIMSSIIFGYFFYYVDDSSMAILAAVCGGALIPFFLHNVFGKTSRMFIGDGGTLVMGMVMSIFVIHILDAESQLTILSERGIGLVPFTMAVLAIPVFDTVRVMSSRIYRGRSPFMPDKTHLHHLFIYLGFSHAGTTFCILVLNALVVLIWLLLWKLGVSVEGQFYVVVLLGLLLTFGLYPFVKSLSKTSSLFRVLRIMSVLSHVERKGAFMWMQRKLDKV